MAHLALSVLVGLVAGLLSGAFGIGGGIVTTPAIRLLMGAPALIAVGTPLPVIIPSALTGAFSYARRGVADVGAGLVIALAGALAAVLGALGADKAGGTVVLFGTAVLVLWAAGDTLLQARTQRRAAQGADGAQAPQGGPAAQDSGKPPVPGAWRLVAIGVITGAYSGFFGLGGGFVVVPLLTRWCRFDIKRAIGTSLVAVSVLAVPGTITHALLGNIDWGIAAGLTLGVIPGAVLGARLTLLARDRSVRYAFAALLIAVGTWLAYSELTGVLR